MNHMPKAWLPAITAVVLVMLVVWAEPRGVIAQLDEPQLPATPAGVTPISGPTLQVGVGADAVRAYSGGEVTSVTSSDPTILTVDANYSSFGGVWNLNYRCKKAGVAVVTITLKNGKKDMQVVGCGVRFGSQPRDTSGDIHQSSVTAWVDQNGTLVVKGYTIDTDDTTHPIDVAVTGYGTAAGRSGTTPAPGTTPNATTPGNPPGGSSATNPPPGANSAGSSPGTGMKELPPYKDPKTGNTTTGTTKTVSPDANHTYTTTTTKTVTPTGTEVSRSDVTVQVAKTDNGTLKQTSSTIKGADGSEETTYVTEGFDLNGNQISGAKTVITVDPGKKQKTTTHYNWDSDTKAYVQDGDPKVEPIAMATHPTVMLPGTASAGSVVTGTVETQVNEAAAGTVTISSPSGDQHTTIVGAGGHFVLPAGWVVAGAKLAIKDELGNVIANEGFQDFHFQGSGVIGGVVGPFNFPEVGQVPDILPQGGVAHITGSHLCDPTAVTPPNVVLTTPRTANVVPALASSDKEVDFQVPRTTPPGSGSLAVENGAGQVSASKPVNPVQISITTPPTVRVGQAFDATITIDGLTPANRQKAIMATVVVNGNATFASGAREQRVPIKDGMAKVPVVAKGPGGYEVRVTGLSD